MLPDCDRPEYRQSFRFLFRHELMEAKTDYVSHSHSWGQVIFVTCNMLWLKIGEERLLTPAGVPIWIPPGLSHSCYNHKRTCFHILEIGAEFCKKLPTVACLLQVSGIINAIVDDFYQRDIFQPHQPADLRLCDVLLDQLNNARAQNSYLPTSHDRYLQPVLQALEENPADNTTVAEWAKRVYTTERTLARRCQSELNMSFSEWRQRLRFVRAISKLEKGLSVKEVALDVGYSSASAFIVMFQQLSGTTPERYRTRSGWP